MFTLIVQKDNELFKAILVTKYFMFAPDVKQKCITKMT